MSFNFLRKENFNLILCNFLVWMLQYFAHENMKKPFSKVASDRPKSSPNLHFWSIKIAHRLTYVQQLCVGYRIIENIEVDIAIRFKKIQK